MRNARASDPGGATAPQSEPSNIGGSADPRRPPQAPDALINADTILSKPREAVKNKMRTFFVAHIAGGDGGMEPFRRRWRLS